MDRPDIDIVVPTHRGGPHLDAALRSVMRQDSASWRLHVLDDASPGTGVRDTVEALDDPRVTWIRHERPGGINLQFRRALTTGSAPYLVILGHDDELAPAYVSRISELVGQHPEVDIVQPGVEVIDHAGRASRPLADRVKRRLAFTPESPTVYGGEALLASLLRGNWCYFPSLCWKRSTARAVGFPEGYEIVLDLALITDILMAGGQMLVTPDVLFRYRRHPASASAEQALDGRRFAEERRLFHEVATRLEAEGMPRAARAARGHLTSRANALLQVPGAASAQDRRAVAALLRHALGAGRQA